MAVIQPSLFPFSPSSTLPPGFRYCPYVITPDDECRLLNRIADLPFKEFQFHGFEGKRRVVSFGWRYDFSEHKALPADPIPDFVLELHRKVQAASGFALPDLAQVLVTEYAPGAPIGWHKDRPFFDDVMGLSLASACNFRLRKSLDEGKWRRVSLRLEPRSAYLLQGAARREWEHSIPPVESLRYSLTFRNLRSRAATDASFAESIPSPLTSGHEVSRT
jgi:alkylated DNA repair dioxygenase AlkB